MPETIPLEDHLCFKLYVASRMVIRGYAEPLRPLDLTYPKYLVLLALGEENGQTVGHLAQRLSLDFGTLSPLLQGLAASGYVERRRMPEDERTVTSHLTPAGRQTLKKAMGIAYQLFCDTQMTYPELVELRTQLNDYIGRCQVVLATHKSQGHQSQNQLVKKKGRSK